MNRCPLVAIVILNWNGWRDTVECVESCQRLSWQERRIIVVDNASADGSEGLLRQQLRSVEILQSGANLGFAGGNNLGIRRVLDADADYIWLLNNDAIADPEALTALVEALEGDPVAGIAGSKIYLHSDPRRLSFAGGLWRKGWLRLRQLGANQIDTGQFDQQRETGSVSGCSMLIRSSVIRDIGLMDEEFFLYWEDTEWCARAQQNGHRALFVPSSRVWHKESVSAGKGSFTQHYYFIRNGFFFLRRHDPIWLPVFVFHNLLFGMKCLLSGHVEPLQGLACGFIDFLAGKRGMITRERHPIPQKVAG